MTKKKTESLYRYSRYFKLIFLFWDILLLNLTYILSFYTRFGDLSQLQKEDSQELLFLLSNVLWVLLSLYLGAYKFVRIENIETIISRTFKLIAFHFMILVAIILLLKFQNISRLRILIFYGYLFAFIFIFRLLFIQLLKKLRKSGLNFRSVVIVGANKTGREINKLLSKDLAYGYKILGHFDDNTTLSSPFVKILGKIEDVHGFITENQVHEVYYTLDEEDTAQIMELINHCENNLIRIKIVPNFMKFTDSKRVNIDFYGNIPILSLRKEPLEVPLNRIVKKIFDLVAATIIILFITPLLLPILIILIRVSSKGPVFFKQKRPGLHNETFWIYKFRTMRINDQADTLQATKNDPRITKIGAFLRKTNLDELPQIFNVLKGEMSIVGPRPQLVNQTSQYTPHIKKYLVRHFAKPGITGWAQVNGFRGETKELEQMAGRIEYDIWYIENWSFLLDLKVIFLTGFKMIKGDKQAF
jgi:putative colanic acid biosysnthesis UDP-glucose lipid carrier transferase